MKHQIIGTTQITSPFLSIKNDSLIQLDFINIIFPFVLKTSLFLFECRRMTDLYNKLVCRGIRKNITYFSLQKHQQNNYIIFEKKNRIKL
jgi:hypothetical protein